MRIGEPAAQQIMAELDQARHDSIRNMPAFIIGMVKRVERDQRGGF